VRKSVSDDLESPLSFNVSQFIVRLSVYINVLYCIHF